MPIVKVGEQKFSFPDSMSRDEIRAALQKRFPPQEEKPGMLRRILGRPAGALGGMLGSVGEAATSVGRGEFDPYKIGSGALGAAGLAVAPLVAAEETAAGALQELPTEKIPADVGAHELFQGGEPAPMVGEEAQQTGRAAIPYMMTATPGIAGPAFRALSFGRARKMLQARSIRAAAAKAPAAGAAKAADTGAVGVGSAYESFIDKLTGGERHGEAMLDLVERASPKAAAVVTSGKVKIRPLVRAVASLKNQRLPKSGKASTNFLNRNRAEVELLADRGNINAARWLGRTEQGGTVAGDVVAQGIEEKVRGKKSVALSTKMEDITEVFK